MEECWCLCLLLTLGIVLAPFMGTTGERTPRSPVIPPSPPGPTVYPPWPGTAPQTPPITVRERAQPHRCRICGRSGNTCGHDTSRRQ